MKFVIIFGPPAVGKMTVGHELAKRTGLKLFHNHMSIELALNFFDFGQPQFNRLVGEFRQRIFEEVADSNLPGLIFTYVWALDHPSDKAFVDQCCDIFRTKGGAIYFVELEADQEERLKRNASPLRLEQKPSKRDVEESEKRLLEADQQYALNSDSDFFYRENYLKINNTKLAASEVAKKITETFAFDL
ncbi:MAG: AAA family ATPase [Candidatus Latescibacteria bacterium]|nr:AAA family ATPase [Candidatus Latescibacterota bacterium]